MDFVSGQFGGMSELDREPNVGWLIKGWLPSMELCCMYGKGGTFKSYIALGWSLELATKGFRTLFVAAEGTSGLKSRVGAWAADRGITDTIPDWHYYNAGIAIDDPHAMGHWLSFMDAYLSEIYGDKVGLDLIVIDTLARNFHGDENSAKEVGMFIEGCEYLRREYGATVLVIHHTTKDGKFARGTDALRNATFAMYHVYNPQYSSYGISSVSLECDRMKDAPLPVERRVSFKSIVLDVDHHGTVHSQGQSMQPFKPEEIRIGD